MDRLTFERWEREAKAIAGKLCSLYRTWHLFEDMVSESYVTLAKLVKEGKDVENMESSQLRRIIKNSIISFLRRYFGRKGHKNHLYLENAFLDENGTSKWEERIKNGKCPEERFLSKEMKERLSRAIENLSEEERFLIEKIYLEGVGSRKVARMLKISPSAVTQRKKKILEKLRKAVE